MSWFLDTVDHSYAAVRLAALASSPNPDLVEVFAVLGEYDLPTQAAIGQRAITLGADPAQVALMLKIVEGETINVSSKAPTKYSWWPYLLVAGAVVGVGGYAYSRHRRTKG